MRPSQADSPPQATRRPNVVLIITDQQRYDTIHATGQEAIRTPNLDRLVAEGVSFSHACCAAPICSPARGSILTGLYPHSHGLVANHQARPGIDRIHLGDDVKVLADYLKPAGYRTAYIGKWHLGTGSDRRGFTDFVIRYADGEGDTSRPEDNDYARYAEKFGIRIGGKRLGKEPDPARYDKRIMSGPSLIDLAHYASMYFTNKAVEFIRDAASRPEPFLLVWSTNEPHPSFICPEPFWGMYDPASVKLPPNWGDASGQWLLQRPDPHLVPARHFSEQDLRRMWAAYLGTVSYLDFLVGIMLSALRDTDMLDDTLLIFTSDHGELAGSHGLLKKGACLYEESVRVPLIVRPPDNLGTRGVRCESLVSHVDLLPTILSLCYADVPPAAQGVDLSPLLRGEARELRSAVQAEYHSGGWTDPLTPLRMWRTPRWKYVEARLGDHELYDLVEDPWETRNLAGQPAFAAIQARLADDLHRWCRETGDAWPEVPMPSSEDMAVSGEKQSRRSAVHCELSSRS